MEPAPNPPHPKPGSPLGQRIGAQETRKLQALRAQKTSVWYGLGLFGMVGWAVVVPALAGAALGAWLDRRIPQSFSWTLTLLLTGLVTGCFMAWAWVAKEDKTMHPPKSKTDD